MGCNYYMQVKDPVRYKVQVQEIAMWQYEDLLADPTMEVEMVDYLKVHIAKTSWGWVPSFQKVPANMPFDCTERNNDLYQIESVEDIRRYMRTGKYEIVNEDGDKLTLEEFEERVCGWESVCRKGGFKGEFSRHDSYDALNSYTDPEGYQFCQTCFC